MTEAEKKLIEAVLVESRRLQRGEGLIETTLLAAVQAERVPKDAQTAFKAACQDFLVAKERVDLLERAMPKQLGDEIWEQAKAEHLASKA